MKCSNLSKMIRVSVEELLSMTFIKKGDNEGSLALKMYLSDLGTL